MIDIGFYSKVFDLKQEIMAGKLFGRDYVFYELEKYRSKTPVIYNIETTNACNMRCEMCPRTTMMTRPVENLDMELFKKIADQISPYTNTEWSEWETLWKKNMVFQSTI